ncbi:MAG: hypothetical protein KBT45_10145 [Bacteroidales bacterium]|nr:hypothetical protein [Candidatus Colimorpha pelethequi]
MLRNYAALCTMYGKDPEGYARRACWWTKELDERFYAKPIEQMGLTDLLSGGNRSQTRVSLEEWLMEKVSYDMLQDANSWYWQSDTYPEFVLLQSWFE